VRLDSTEKHGLILIDPALKLLLQRGWDELARLKKIAAPALSELSIQWVEDPSTQSGCFSVSRENSLVDGGIEAILNSVLGETKLAA